MSLFNNAGIAELAASAAEMWLFYGTNNNSSSSNIGLVNNYLFGKYRVKLRNVEEMINALLRQFGPTFGAGGDFNTQLHNLGVKYAQQPVSGDYKIDVGAIVNKTMLIFYFMYAMFNENRGVTIPTPQQQQQQQQQQRSKRVRKQPSFGSMPRTTSVSRSRSNSNSQQRRATPVSYTTSSTTSPTDSITNSPSNMGKVGSGSGGNGVSKYRVSSSPPPFSDQTLEYVQYGGIGGAKKRTSSGGDFDLTSSIQKLRQQQQLQLQQQLQQSHSVPLSQEYGNANSRLVSGQSQHYQTGLQPPQRANPQYVQPHTQKISHSQYQKQQQQQQQQRQENLNHIRRSENYRDYGGSAPSGYVVSEDNYVTSNVATNGNYGNGGFGISGEDKYTVNENSMARMQNDRTENELPAVPTPSMVIQ